MRKQITRLRPHIARHGGSYTNDEERRTALRRRRQLIEFRQEPGRHSSLDGWSRKGRYINFAGRALCHMGHVARAEAAAACAGAAQEHSRPSACSPHSSSIFSIRSTPGAERSASSNTADTAASLAPGSGRRVTQSNTHAEAVGARAIQTQGWVQSGAREN